MTVNHRPHEKKEEFFRSIHSQWRRNSKSVLKVLFIASQREEKENHKFYDFFHRFFCSLNSVARVNDRHVWIKGAALIICLLTTSFNNSGINPVSLALSSVSALVIAVECRSAFSPPERDFVLQNMRRGSRLTRQRRNFTEMLLWQLPNPAVIIIKKWNKLPFPNHFSIRIDLCFGADIKVWKSWVIVCLLMLTVIDWTRCNAVA